MHFLCTSSYVHLSYRAISFVCVQYLLDRQLQRTQQRNRGQSFFTHRNLSVLLHSRTRYAESSGNPLPRTNEPRGDPARETAYVSRQSSPSVHASPSRTTRTHDIWRYSFTQVQVMHRVHALAMYSAI
ncbi:unnamed protein product [Trichogramma brassicae]|uniref:Uncharacterized protein n=1 Tax=Trichogramma brassicae TaxID=86971 RepID=A0A6H5IFF0_9HYME|nr:unnamed protein product [Trichogramma brassicae]